MYINKNIYEINFHLIEDWEKNEIRINFFPLKNQEVRPFSKNLCKKKKIKKKTKA